MFQVSTILQGFNITLDFPVFCNWSIFSLDLVPQYLIFEIFYVRFSAKLSMNEYSEH